jgi:hypothetical protein
MTLKDKAIETGCTAMQLHADDKGKAIAFLERDLARSHQKLNDAKAKGKPAEINACNWNIKCTEDAIDGIQNGFYDRKDRDRMELNAAKTFAKQQGNAGIFG